MKRLLLLTACLTIVPAIRPAIAAAPPVSEDLPVPGGIVAFARLTSIDPAPDRGRFMYELTRILLQNDPQRSPELLAARLKPRAQGSDTRPAALDGRDTVPVPLTADWWSSHVFHRKVSREELVAAIASDRQAALICHGLSALDDDTLAFFAEHGSIASRLIEKLAAPAFAAFSGSLHVRGDRVVPAPADAAALWEAALGEKTTRADRFVELLYVTNEGRIAYLFDTIGQLDPARRAFALGLFVPDAAARTERFRLLAMQGVNVFREWHVRDMPLGRASYDLGMALARVEAAENGAPAAPFTRGFWGRALTGRDTPSPDDEQPIDAVWLVETVGSGDVRQRGERQDQFAFGQRLARTMDVGSERDVLDARFAVRSFPRFRMLLIALERMGVRRPATYAAAVRFATRLSAFDGHRGFLLQAQFQGALALVARSRASRTLDAASAESLVERLLAAPIGDDGRYAGGVAAWMRDAFLRAAPRAADAERAVVGAMAGAASGDASRSAAVTWEGQQYRLDLGASERQRLGRVREKQEAIPLDAALAVSLAGRQLAARTANIAAVVEQLTDAADRVPRHSRDRDPDNAPAGTGTAVSHQDVLKKLADELGRLSHAPDPRRLARAADAVTDLGDDMLASSLLSFAYAADIGDPDGTVLLADDVSGRHDFGFGVRDGDVRPRVAWAAPREEILPNVPWHVTGSLLGLDVALASLALRRVSSDNVLEPPHLIAPEREAFALTVSLINPFALRDADRDAIAEAVARGTRRVQTLTERTVDAIADELSLDGGRRRALRWTLAHEPARALSMLSMAELVVLGGGRLDALAPWGMAAAGPLGCFCTALTTPARWWPMARRPQLGLTAAVVGDLNLHVAVVLKQLQLPAALARVVLAAAAQDFIDSVKPTDPGDWLTLARAARSIPRERIEDYVAAATAFGPLMPVATAQQ